MLHVDFSARITALLLHGQSEDRALSIRSHSRRDNQIVASRGRLFRVRLWAIAAATAPGTTEEAVPLPSASPTAGNVLQFSALVATTAALPTQNHDCKQPARLRKT
jgi:hypothetical protein